jgi:hypothetical protein
LCTNHYRSTGLRQFHKWRTAGPEEIALDVGDFVQAAVFRRMSEMTPVEIIEWRRKLEDERREQEAAGIVSRSGDGADADRRGQIYFIRLDDRVKIGKSLDVKRRLASFSNPLMHVLATEPGYTIRERQLHGQFAELRVAGEWFRLEPPLTTYIRNLSGYRTSFGSLAQ